MANKRKYKYSKAFRVFMKKEVGWQTCKWLVKPEWTVHSELTMEDGQSYRAAPYYGQGVA